MARNKVLLTREDALAQGQKPTLKTISLMSGLAVPTVSRALNDAHDIGRDTKELVRRIANDIGYVPNRAGVRLRTGRTNVVSLVMSTEHDNNTARLISSVAKGLQGTPFHLNVTPYSPGDDLMKPVHYIVETRSADAIILNQIEPQDPRVAYLMEKNFAFATHGRTIWEKQHAYFDFDNEAFGRNAISLLAERGRKNVLVVAPPPVQNYSQHMQAGFSAAARALDVRLITTNDVNSDCDFQVIFKAMHAALDADQTIDAVVSGSSNAALAATVAIETTGKSVGQEMDVVSKDSNKFLRTFNENILTFPESVADAGAFLAKAAIQAVKQPHLAPMQSLEVPVKVAAYGS